MIIRNQYYWWTGLTLAITVYLCVGEIAQRFDDLYVRYMMISEKRSTILSSEEYAVRKIEVEQEKQYLMQWAHQNILKGEQGQGSLFEFMNANASANHVLVQSIIPKAPIEEGKARIIPFAINAIAQYHDIALFVNRLEVGATPIMIQDLSIRSERIGDQRLTISLKGQARLFTENK